MLEHRALNVELSVGYATSTNGEGGRQLLRRADAAMYNAKRCKAVGNESAAHQAIG